MNKEQLKDFGRALEMDKNSFIKKGRKEREKEILEIIDETPIPNCNFHRKFVEIYRGAIKQKIKEKKQ